MQNRVCSRLVALCTMLGVLGAGPATPRDGAHDFDFLLGTWREHFQVLRHPLTGSHDWYAFDGRSIVYPLLGGAGQIEDADLSRPGGHMRALTLRIYGAASHDWSLYWATAKTGLNTLPQVGHFNDKRVGVFLARDTYNGKPIVVRYLWQPGALHRWRFEQAFSSDGGKTWETNWISTSIEKLS
jgi:hypothetical protein